MAVGRRWTIVTLLAFVVVAQIAVQPVGGNSPCVETTDVFGFTGSEAGGEQRWLVGGRDESLVAFDDAWERTNETELSELLPGEWRRADEIRATAVGIDWGPGGRAWILFDDGHVAPLDRNATVEAEWTETTLDPTEDRGADIEYALGRWWAVWESELVAIRADSDAPGGADWGHDDSVPDTIRRTTPRDPTGLAGTDETLTVIGANGDLVTYDRRRNGTVRVRNRSTAAVEATVLDVERASDGSWWVLTGAERVVEFTDGWERTGDTASVHPDEDCERNGLYGWGLVVPGILFLVVVVGAPVLAVWALVEVYRRYATW
ncbi:hypothetical protein ACOZ4N_03655 [Halorientalis pallida]|uniref:hypothetical protein n=1 Tax=Halorientalis pallida TaxID=2479928 RepID=UPI003C7050C2